MINKQVKFFSFALNKFIVFFLNGTNRVTASSFAQKIFVSHRISLQKYLNSYLCIYFLKFRCFSKKDKKIVEVYLNSEKNLLNTKKIIGYLIINWIIFFTNLLLFDIIFMSHQFPWHMDNFFFNAEVLVNQIFGWECTCLNVGTEWNSCQIS